MNEIFRWLLLAVVVDERKRDTANSVTIESKCGRWFSLVSESIYQVVLILFAMLVCIILVKLILSPAHCMLLSHNMASTWDISFMYSILTTCSPGLVQSKNDNNYCDIDAIRKHWTPYGIIQTMKYIQNLTLFMFK